MSEQSSKRFTNPNLQHITTLEAPVTSAGTPPSPEGPTNPNKKRKVGILLGGISVVAAGALAATLAVGLNSGNKSAGEHTPEGTKTSAPATPGSTETQAPNTGVEAPILTGEALTKAFTIPENLTGDDLAKTFVQKIQDWGQYGENIKTQDGVLGYSDNILANQSETGGQTIAEALVASENITSPLMSKFVSDNIAENEAIAEAWAKTYFPDKSKNPEPYTIKEAFNQTLEFTGTSNVSTDPDGVTTMDIAFTQHTTLKNTMDPTVANTINPDNAGFARDNVKVVWRVQFVQEGGATKVKSAINITQ